MTPGAYDTCIHCGTWGYTRQSRRCTNANGHRFTETKQPVRELARTFARLAIHGMHAGVDPVEMEPGHFVFPRYPEGSVEVAEFARALAKRLGLDVDAGPLTIAEQEKKP